MGEKVVAILHTLFPFYLGNSLHISKQRICNVMWPSEVSAIKFVRYNLKKKIKEMGTNLPLQVRWNVSDLEFPGSVERRRFKEILTLCKQKEAFKSFKRMK